MSNAENIFISRMIANIEAQLADKKTPDDHTGGGNGSGGNGVEARVARLESDVEYIKRDIGELKTSVKAVEADVAILKTQSALLLQRTETMASDMVTKGQLAIYALGAALAVLGGAWWIVQQYLAPILAGLPQ